MNLEENSEIKDEALRKIGRNVVNFQKIEGMLKLIISRHNLKGPINDFESLITEKRNSVEYDSLGKLAKEYFNSIYSDSENEKKYTPVEKSHFEISLKITAEDGSLPIQKKEFQSMVAERNRLIHQMLVSFNPCSTESCQALITELDKQNETIKRHYTNLQNLILAFQEGINQLAKEDYADNC